MSGQRHGIQECGCCHHRLQECGSCHQRVPSPAECRAGGWSLPPDPKTAILETWLTACSLISVAFVAKCGAGFHVTHTRRDLPLSMVPVPRRRGNFGNFHACMHSANNYPNHNKHDRGKLGIHIQHTWSEPRASPFFWGGGRCPQNRCPPRVERSGGTVRFVRRGMNATRHPREY